MAKTTEGRQRIVEARLQIAWAGLACSVLRSIAGREIVGNPVGAMREFLRVYYTAEKEGFDPATIGIRMVSLDRGENDPELHTNMIVRGSLQMVAARLEEGAAKPGPRPGAPSGPAYEVARQEVVRGLMLMQERALKSRRDGRSST